LNVRSGPGQNYDQIARLREGQQAAVLGTNPERSWFYIQIPGGGLGWVSSEFVILFVPNGDINTIPVVPIPPSPTPGPTDTASTPPDIVIDGVTLSPARPVPGQPFSANVNVRNAGTTAAGHFAVAASWKPGDVYTATDVNSLNPGQTVTVVLTATVTGTGVQQVAVVGDLNNEVIEGNEGNNIFDIIYVVDAIPAVNSAGSYTAPITVTLAGATADFDWTGAAFNAQVGTTLDVVGGVSYDNATVGLLGSGSIVSGSVATTNVGTIIGLRTGDGHCGFMRIDSVVGATITLTYRMYAPGDCPP
jgi:hypothetical protein